MKIITIGRDDNCDIIIEDPMISRRHAVLRLHPSGRIEIIDYSQNGTGVNGVKIANGKIMRIKRGDSVTFAGIKPLNWKEVPDPSKPFKIILWITACVVGLLLLLWGFISVKDVIESRSVATETEITEEPPSQAITTPQESTQNGGKKKEAADLTTEIPNAIKEKGEAAMKKKDEKKKNIDEKEPEEQKDNKNDDSEKEKSHRQQWL